MQSYFHGAGNPDQVVVQLLALKIYLTLCRYQEDLHWNIRGKDNLDVLGYTDEDSRR